MSKEATVQEYLQKAGTVSKEYLNIFKNKFGSAVVDTVYMAESLSKTVIPGNPVTREYELFKHVGSAGPGLLWKLYAGIKKSTKQEATIFVLNKKCLEIYTKRDREFIIEAFKKGATQLARIKHPRILGLQHQLEESKDSLAFATEPCFCSLANALGNHDNMPLPLPAEFTDFKLLEVEIKYGLMQLAEGLSFLHKDVKLLHRNICPESIIINSNGAWKIAGFELFVTNINDANDPLKFPFKEWDGSVDPILNPRLEYLAPEYGLDSKCDTSSDMFSYGMLFFSVYNNGNTLYKCDSIYTNFVHSVEQIRKTTNEQLAQVPSDMKEYLKMLLHINPELRPDAGQVMKIPFFDDVAVKTLEYLDSSFQVDNLQKSLFFKSLPQIIDKLPQRVCLQRIIPCLEQEFINPDMIPFLLPNIFLIAEQSNNDEYVKYILPRLKTIFKLQKPVQILLIVLRNMSLVLSKTPTTDIKEHILPMVCRSLEADTVEIQELCLTTLPSFANLLDTQTIKHQLIPRIRKLTLESGTLSVRVNSLVCIGKLLEFLEKWVVLDDILPILEKINCRDPAVLMAMLGIFKVVLTHPKLGITKDILATRVLPYLIPISIDSNLNMKQFTSYMTLIKEMLTQIETEQKKKLEQIEAMEREKSIIPYSIANTSILTKQKEVPKGPETMMDQLMIGYGVSTSSNPINPTNPPPNFSNDAIMTASSNANKPKRELTLSEKQELANKLDKDFSSQQPQNGYGHKSGGDLMSMTNSMSLNNMKSNNTTSNASIDKNYSYLTDLNFSNSSNSNNTSSQKAIMPSSFSSNSGFQQTNLNSGLNSGFNNMNNNFNSSTNRPNFNSQLNNNMQANGNFNNSNQQLGFFGNLALPAPPMAAMSAGPRPMMNNSTTTMNSTTPSSAGFPLTLKPTVVQNKTSPNMNTSFSNNNKPSGAQSKKTALDDLADIFG